VDSFYRMLAERGGVTREALQADGSRMLPIWSVLRPYMRDWLAADSELEAWHNELIRSVMDYEEQRLKFVDDETAPLDEEAARGENWVAFLSDADVTAVFEAIQTEAELTEDLVRPTAVVLVSHGNGSYRGYTANASRIDELGGHPLLALAPLEASTASGQTLQ